MSQSCFRVSGGLSRRGGRRGQGAGGWAGWEGEVWVWVCRMGMGVPYLQLYPFPPRAGADLDYLAGELDAYGLRGEHAPLILDKAVQETRSTPSEKPTLAIGSLPPRRITRRSLGPCCLGKRERSRGSHKNSLSAAARSEEDDLREIVVHASELLQATRVSTWLPIPDYPRRCALGGLEG